MFDFGKFVGRVTLLIISLSQAIQMNSTNLLNNCTQDIVCSQKPDCIMYENVTCRVHHPDPCIPHFYSDYDQSEILCNPNEITVCENENSTLFCKPPGKIKVWYAMFGGAPSNLCSTNFTEGKRLSKCPLVSVLWEVSQLCDNVEVCNLTASASSMKVTPCHHNYPGHLIFDYSCIGTKSSNRTQSMLYLFILVGLVSFFLLGMMGIFITIHVKKKLKESYQMNSLTAPLTENENPEI